MFSKEPHFSSTWRHLHTTSVIGKCVISRNQLRALSILSGIHLIKFSSNTSCIDNATWRRFCGKGKPYFRKTFLIKILINSKRLQPLCCSHKHYLHIFYYVYGAKPINTEKPSAYGALQLSDVVTHVKASQADWGWTWTTCGCEGVVCSLSPLDGGFLITVYCNFGV